MKKIILGFMMIVFCIVMLCGCGDKEPVADNAEIDSQAQQEETNKEQNGNQFNMTREEVIEKYFKPQDGMKADFMASTDPDEIERIAQDYNKMVLEGVAAYREATGEDVDVDYIPRSEYLARAAWYRKVKDYDVTTYDMHLTYSQEAVYDYDDNPYPTNMIVYDDDDNVVSVNPEISDSMIILEKRTDPEKLITSDIVEFVIIKDGGREVIEGATADYVDGPVEEMHATDEYVFFYKPGINNIVLYKFAGDKLEYVNEVFDFEEDPDIPESGYGTIRIEQNSARFGEDAYFHEIDQLRMYVRY